MILKHFFHWPGHNLSPNCHSFWKTH